MQWKSKIKNNKDDFSPMFAFLPRECEDCGQSLWLEKFTPRTGFRWGARCEICGGFAFPTHRGAFVIGLGLVFFIFITIFSY